MIIHIYDTLTVSDVQERFSKCFPLLKIEFYSKHFSLHEMPGDHYKIDPAIKLGQVRRHHNQGELELKSWYTVNRTEKDFRERFGLNVKVFRSENGGWVHTSRTGSCSLHEQEEMARHTIASIDPLVHERPEEYDELL